MSQTTTHPEIDDQQSQIENLKPYHQQPGEPDKWYDRFHRFCLLGPSRSLLQAYRDVMTERAALCEGGAGRRPSRRARTVSQTWRKRARQFDWFERAAAWDADQRELALKHADEILNHIMKGTLRALRIHMDMMDGQYKGPLGEALSIEERREIRVAAKTMFAKGVDLIPLLQLQQTHERPEITFTEVRVPAPWTEDPDRRPVLSEVEGPVLNQVEGTKKNKK